MRRMTKRAFCLANCWRRPAIFSTDFSTPAALIVPRVGMVSPWASKAGDILKRCGIADLRRVERGILIRHEEVFDLAAAVCDRMTQNVLVRLADWPQLFAEMPPKVQTVPSPSGDVAAIISKANEALGLALSNPEIAHLTAMYARLNREPTESELLMFAQAIPNIADTRYLTPLGRTANLL